MGKNNKKKVKTGKNKKLANISPKWTIANVIIQTIIGCGIIAAFILTLLNLIEQKKFNRDSLRPWVSSKPHQNIEISGGYIRIHHRAENSGKIPAYSVIIYSTLTNDKDFPVDIFKRKMNKDTVQLAGFIPTGKTIYSKSNMINVNEPTGQAASRSFIIEQLRDPATSIFIHIYIEYQDFNENKYYFRSTNLLQYIDECEEGCICNWIMIYASEEPL